MHSSNQGALVSSCCTWPETPPPPPGFLLDLRQMDMQDHTAIPGDFGHPCLPLTPRQAIRLAHAPSQSGVGVPPAQCGAGSWLWIPAEGRKGQKGGGKVGLSGQRQEPSRLPRAKRAACTAPRWPAAFLCPGGTATWKEAPQGTLHPVSLHLPRLITGDPGRGTSLPLSVPRHFLIDILAAGWTVTLFQPLALPSKRPLKSTTGKDCPAPPTLPYLALSTVGSLISDLPPHCPLCHWRTWSPGKPIMALHDCVLPSGSSTCKICFLRGPPEAPGSRKGEREKDKQAGSDRGHEQLGHRGSGVALTLDPGISPETPSTPGSLLGWAGESMRPEPVADPSRRALPH